MANCANEMNEEEKSQYIQQQRTYDDRLEHNNKLYRKIEFMKY